jgi:hypothetical protein
VLGLGVLARTGDVSTATLWSGGIAQSARSLATEWLYFFFKKTCYCSCCTTARVRLLLIFDGELSTSVFKHDKLSQLPLMIVTVALTSFALMAPNVTVASRTMSLL